MIFEESPEWTRRLDIIESLVPVAAVIIVSILIFLLCMLVFALYEEVSASIIDTDTSPALQTDSNLNTTEDTQDVDIQIDLDEIEERIENETWSSPINPQVTDIDLNGVIPEGVTIIATHDRLFVTKAPWKLDLSDEVYDELRRQIADP